MGSIREIRVFDDTDDLVMLREGNSDQEDRKRLSSIDFDPTEFDDEESDREDKRKHLQTWSI